MSGKPDGRILRAHPLVTAERAAAAQKLARQIDLEEGEAIKGKAKAFATRKRAARELVAQIQAERQRLGLSIERVGEASGIGRSNVSRLEAGRVPNPTLDTVIRLAGSVGLSLTLRKV